MKKAYSLLDAATSTTSSAPQEEFTLEKLHEIANQLESHRVKPKRVILNPKTMSNPSFGNWGNSGLLSITLSEHCKEGEVFVIGEPEEVGVMPVRQDLACYRENDPVTNGLNLIANERIGMSLINTDAVAKVQVGKKPKNRKYRFISK